MIYEKYYSRINDAIYSITRRMKERTKVLLVFLCILVLESLFFTDFAAYREAEMSMGIGSVLVALISIFCVNCKSQPLRVIKKPYYLAVTFSAGIILITLHHEVGEGYLFFAFDLLLFFPFLYYVVVNSDCTKRLFKLLSFGVVVESIFTFIICINLSLNGNLGMAGNRVMGHLSNPNLLGIIGLISLISGLYLIMDNNNPLTVNLILSSVIGIGTYYLIGSSSRAALLAAMGCVLAFVLFFLKRRKHITKKNNYFKSLMTVVVFALTLIIGLSLNDINAHFKDIREAATVGSEQQSMQNQSPNEVDELQRRINPKKDLDTFTSGRIGIWKIYIENFSIIGKDPDDVKEQFSDYTEWRAHNNFIEYCFKLGYIVGAIYVGFFIIVGVCGLKVLFSTQYKTEEDFYLVAIIGSYALYSMVEIATLPFTRFVPCLFFLSISSLVFSRKEKTQEVIADNSCNC